MFEPHHVGAMQAYLRQIVINRIRDEVRRVTRRPVVLPLPDDAASDRTGPLVLAMRSETYARYREALTHLRAREREIIIGRIDLEWSVREIADRLGFPTVAAAHMAIVRASRRLARQLNVDLGAPVLRVRRRLGPPESPAHPLDTNGVAARELSGKRKLRKPSAAGKVQRRGVDSRIRKLPVESGADEHAVVAMSQDG
jgi:RNA polymerase sigma factor (sigma-70 family)